MTEAPPDGLAVPTRRDTTTEASGVRHTDTGGTVVCTGNEVELVDILELAALQLPLDI